MSLHSEKARSLFKQGYNCSQAVLGAFVDELGLDFNTAMKLASSFGGGMGRMREVCGAVSGAFMVMGLIYGYNDPKDRVAKGKHYARIQALGKQFKNAHGSIICRELLKGVTADTSPTPSERTPEYYKKRSCLDMVGDAAELVDNYIKTHEPNNQKK